MTQLDPPWHAGRGPAPPPSDSHWTVCEGPLGPLTVLADADGVRCLYFDGGAPPLMPGRRRAVVAAEEQLAAYFAGELRAFDLPLALRGNRLERAVWARLQQLPYGTTITYGRLARDIDPALFPSGALPGPRTQLVAYAVARNPAPILVPSHRAAPAGGRVGRRGAGGHRQLALLELERRGLAGAPPEPDPLRPQLALL
jgi:methylated-DNA-[protein]-cysteine S-methyltransferase